MRRSLARVPAIPGRALLVALAIALAASACSPSAPAADTPGGIVQTALQKLAAKDLDGLRTLACAGQEDRIRDQLGLAGIAGSAQLIPGLDTQRLLDAITLDVGQVKLGTASESGDVATVPVSGSVKVTFDATTMRPLLKQVLAQRGTTMSDEQLDALLKTLQAYGQDVPVDQTVRLVRENGAWKICQETLAVPSPS